MLRLTYRILFAKEKRSTNGERVGDSSLGRMGCDFLHMVIILYRQKN